MYDIGNKQAVQHVHYTQLEFLASGLLCATGNLRSGQQLVNTTFACTVPCVQGASHALACVQPSSAGLWWFQCTQRPTAALQPVAQLTINSNTCKYRPHDQLPTCASNWLTSSCKPIGSLAEPQMACARAACRHHSHACINRQLEMLMQHQRSQQCMHRSAHQVTKPAQ